MDREFGQRLRRLRDWRGQTQEQLAGFAGKSARWLSEVENGRAVPDLRDIRGFALGLRSRRRSSLAMSLYQDMTGVGPKLGAAR